MAHVQHQHSDSDAAAVAECLHRYGAKADLIARTLNYLHEYVTYTVVTSTRHGDPTFSIHRQPDDDKGYRPTVEVWSNRKKA